VSLDSNSIVAAPLHAPSRTLFLLPLLLSHNLPLPRVHQCVMGPHRPRLVVSRETATHCEGDPGGRLVLIIVMDLSDGSTDRLVVGKRCIKTVRAAVSSEDAPAAGHAPAGTAYRLSVCAPFERAWQQVVAHHGVDWCGFSAIQAAYHALHEHGQASAARAEEANVQACIGY
jgi:hypothetical protein